MKLNLMKNLNMSTQEDHLSKATRIFLNSCGDGDNEKRIRQIQLDTWIGYGAARNVIDRIEDLVQRPRVSRMHSMLVIASTDNGKTSIRKRVEAKHESYATPDSKVHMPVVSIQMPSNPDEKTLYNAIVKGMRHPTYMSSKIDHIRGAVISLIEELHVKLLMIDEVQHIDRIPYRRQRILLDSLKYLSNECSLPIVAFGTEEAINVFHSDLQLQNRFKKIYLPKWDFNENLIKLIKSIEQLLPLKEASNLGEEVMATYIYSKTNGTIGEINTLLRNSAILALRYGHERITREIIEETKFESSQTEPL